MFFDNIRKGLRDISERMTVSLTSEEEDLAQEEMLFADFHHLQAIADQLRCILCCGLMKLPISLPCGHSACSKCWADYSSKQENRVRDSVMCVLCDRFYPVTLQVQPNAALCAVSVILLKRGFQFRASGTSSPHELPKKGHDDTVQEDHRFSIGEDESVRQGLDHAARPQQETAYSAHTAQRLRNDDDGKLAKNVVYGSKPVSQGYTISTDTSRRVVSTPVLGPSPADLVEEDTLQDNDVVFIEKQGLEENDSNNSSSNRLSFVPSYLSDKLSSNFLHYNKKNEVDDVVVPSVAIDSVQNTPIQHNEQNNINSVHGSYVASSGVVSNESSYVFESTGSWAQQDTDDLDQY